MQTHGSSIHPSALLFSCLGKYANQNFVSKNSTNWSTSRRLVIASFLWRFKLSQCSCGSHPTPDQHNFPQICFHANFKVTDMQRRRICPIEFASSCRCLTLAMERQGFKCKFILDEEWLFSQSTDLWALCWSFFEEFEKERVVGAMELLTGLVLLALVLFLTRIFWVVRFTGSPLLVSDAQQRSLRTLIVLGSGEEPYIPSRIWFSWFWLKP